MARIAADDQFQGTIQVCGGDKNQNGAAGTQFERIAGVDTLRIDNCGIAAGKTGVSTGGLTDLVGSLIEVDNLFLSGLGKLSAPTGATLMLYVSNLLQIDEGSLIEVSGRGFSQASGPGAGFNEPCGFPGFWVSTGGVHGVGSTDQACFDGVDAYGSPDFPIDFGSGGGATGSNVGGWGGGAAEIYVGGLLQLDGSIRADGTNGDVRVNGAAGGGSGGSLLVIAETITGPGTLEVDGGQGDASTFFSGLGGKAGRIAVYAQNQGLLPTQLLVGGGGTTLLESFLIGAALPLGQGCGGTSGLPDLQAKRPQLGPLGIDLTLQAPSLGSAVLLIGQSVGQSPVDLLPLGMNGCTLAHSIDSIELFPTSGASGQLTIPLPDNPALHGLSLATTALVSDPTANPAGFALSNSWLLAL